MAVIINDKSTNGKFLVKAIDDNGDDIEKLCETREDAQSIANNETKNQVKYYNEFKVIDKLNQHPSGLNFRQWLKDNKSKLQS
ncbi:MAG: hypothetical protein WC549_04620 [Actinomycetota bacterium]